MPIYEYQCNHCQHLFDVIQKMTDAPETVCPACHHEGVTRLVSAAGFQLKGSGWYETDFKNKPKVEKKSESTVSKETSSSDKKTTEAASSSTSKQGDS